MKIHVIYSILVITNLTFATTYYVAPWGSDDSSGTMTAPWQTIGKAAQTMIAGDSVLIRSGTYPESVNPANSGTTGARITYANYSDEEVIVEGGQEVTGWVLDAGNRYRANINFTPSPRFSSSRDPAGNLGGLVLQDGAKMKYAMCLSIAEVDEPGEYYMNDSVGMGPPYTMYVYVRDLGQGYDPNNYQMIIGRRRKGFDLDGGEDYITVDGLIFRDYNDNAVHSIGANYCEFKKLTLYSNFITGIYLTAYSRNCLISQCVFWDNGHGGIELARAHSTTIKRCKFTCVDLGDGLGGNGAHMWLGPIGLSSDSCLIENNIGFKTASDYITSVFIYINGSASIIRHNSGVKFGMAGIALFDGGDNTVINNVVDCDLGIACINVFPNAVADSGHVIQYNDFYALDPTGKYRWNGVAYNSLTEWEVASGQTNNIDSIPGFANPDSEDLHLVAGSACIDGGTATMASSEDYDGITRPQGAGYDIGAFEYISVSANETTAPSSIRGMIIMPNPASRLIRIQCPLYGSLGQLRIFDMSGRLVCTIDLPAEISDVTWNCCDEQGNAIPSGAYLIVYTVGDLPIAERKIVIVQ